MFDSLIDNVDAAKWQEVDAANRPENFKEYHVNIHHKRTDDKTLVYMIALDEGEAKSVELKDALPGKDPLKQIGVIEILLDEEEKHIIGLDLNGDIIVRK